MEIYQSMAADEASACRCSRGTKFVVSQIGRLAEWFSVRLLFVVHRIPRRTYELFLRGSLSVESDCSRVVGQTVSLIASAWGSFVGAVCLRGQSAN